MLAEEGDDISNIEVPKDEEAKPPKSSSNESEKSSASSSSASSTKSSENTTSSTPEAGSPSKHAPHTSKPLMPSVARLLVEYDVSAQDAESIKGTGLRGMLTKGDVLAHLGKAQSPTGAYKEVNLGISAQSGAPAPAKGSKDAPKKSEVSRRVW
jgi:pyruvate/2-oxoglutarate dehydrogenase complex dihydrolipoamide acyltransferase (E2) component